MGRRVAEFWTARKVAWYERALERSDYAEAVLGALGPVLAGATSVLDVGAGCGALALPLARRVRQVTALEPAPAMAGALRRAARAEGLANLEVVEATWGEVALPPHDVVLCAHVGELARPDSAFLREAPTDARRFVVLMRDAGGTGDKFFFRELYPVLLGRPYVPGCDPDDTVEVLVALGVTPTVVRVHYHSDQPFTDLAGACDFWEEYLGVSGPEVRGLPRRAPHARGVRMAGAVPQGGAGDLVARGGAGPGAPRSGLGDYRGALSAAPSSGDGYGALAGLEVPHRLEEALDVGHARHRALGDPAGEERRRAVDPRPERGPGRVRYGSSPAGSRSRR